MNIFEKLLCITDEIKRVNKNLDVGVGKNSYKAVGEADVLAAVKELEKKYGVYSYPCKREIVDRDILETVKEYNGEVTRGNQLFMRLEVTYRFVNIEKIDEFIEVTSYGDGIDTQDKAPGKAMTYADKYALMKAYKIISGEDADQEHSPDNVTYKKKGESKATPKQLDVLKKAYAGPNLTKLLEANGITAIEDLPITKASELIGKLKAKEKANGQVDTNHQ